MQTRQEPDLRGRKCLYQASDREYIGRSAQQIVARQIGQHQQLELPKGKAVLHCPVDAIARSSTDKWCANYERRLRDGKEGVKLVNPRRSQKC
jgi:hypothetical protein